jgi:hypothetical protein
MRTQEEILKKIEEESKRPSLFNFVVSDLMGYLTYENAKPFLKEEVTGELWKTSPCNENSILKEMKDYMPFAWSKANGYRGLSAARSMDHYTAWIWLLGDEYVEKFGDIRNYEFYGKDNLKAICDEFGWADVNHDDGVRENS